MKKLFVLSAGLIALVLMSCNKGEMPKVSLKNDMDSASYYYGQIIAMRQIKGADSMINLNALAMGIADAMKAEKEPNFYELDSYVRQYFTKKYNAYSDNLMKQAEAFMEKNKSVEGIIIDSSGVQYQVIREGTGPKPGPEDIVEVKYEGRLINDTIFDGNMDKPEPAKFGLNQVIPGWRIGLQKMSVGSRYKIFIPPSLGYGAQPPTQTIPPNSVLIFDVELLSVSAPAPQEKSSKKK